MTDVLTDRRRMLKGKNVQSIKVPVSIGKTVDVYGKKVGRFFVHRPVNEDCRWWVVTHIGTGLKFPMMFFRKALAVRFAEEVEGMTNWDKLRIALPRDGTQPKLISRYPTKTQQREMFALADKLFADVCAGRNRKARKRNR